LGGEILLRMPPGLKRLTIPLVGACGVAIGSLVAPTFAAFSGTTENSGNTLSAAADWVAPSASASVIRKSAGGIPGFIKQGGTYYIYANLSDAGNPASGISTASANVSTITSGQTAATLSPGSWTVGGASYNYRSALLTANSVLVDGSKSFSVTMTDAASNSATQNGLTVIVDNIVPAGSDIQTENLSGGENGRPEPGDKVIYSFTERIEPESIVAGWSGGSTNVTVRILDNSANDQVQIWNDVNGAQLALGVINTGGNYVSSTSTFGASGTRSTMVQSNTVIIITLGTLNSGTTRSNNLDTLMWTPSAVATDLAGNNCDVSVVNELGALDPDF
jgi:hypothetical protein